jgi:acetyl esterase/lipase
MVSWPVGMLVVALVALVALAACGGDGGSSPTAAPATTAPATTAPAPAGCPRGGAPARDVAYQSIPGVAPRLLSLDIFPPTDGCPAPVVVWVHGGGWRRGDKANQLADKVRLAREQGWVLVSVNYRLTDAASAEPVRFPTHNEDVAAAVAWVHDNIADYGGDPDRVALLGHSAGAQIVASIGTDERYLGAHALALSDVRCVGALDTEGFDVTARAATGNAVYRAAFGDDPAVWADASPIAHVAAGKAVPTFLVVERGSPSRRRAEQAFVDALHAAGVDATVLDAGALTHGQVNAQIGAPGDTVMTPPLVEFLTGCLA